MLNEKEYNKVHRIYLECLEAVKEYQKKYNVSLDDVPIEKLFSPVKKEYKKITGYNSTAIRHNEIIKHRLADIGDKCKFCGKPLRTTKARFCVYCGKEKE